MCQIIWFVGTRSIIPFWFAYLCIFCQLYRCETVDIGPSQVLFTSSCWLVWRTDRHRSDSQETISKVTLNKTFTRKKFFPPLPQIKSLWGCSWSVCVLKKCGLQQLVHCRIDKQYKKLDILFRIFYMFSFFFLAFCILQSLFLSSILYHFVLCLIIRSSAVL